MDLHFVPGDKRVILAQALEFGHALVPALVVSHDGIDAAFFEIVEIGVAGEAAVGKGDVARREKVPKASKERAFVDTERTFGHIQKHAGGQGEHGDDAQQRA